MTPMRTVELHRWQIVGAFLLLLAVAVGVAVWNDYRIDQAEHRINMNSESIAKAQATAEVAKQLSATSKREAITRDRKICQESNKMKAQIRLTLSRSLATLPTLTYYRDRPAELQRALRQTRETIRDFAPTVCPPQPR